MWVLMPAGSHNVGACQLAWRIVWSSWKHGLARLFLFGRDSGSSPGSGRLKRTLLLEASPIPATSGAQRWQLTYEWAEWRDLKAMRYGPSSVDDGVYSEDVGEGPFGYLTATTSI